MLHAFLLRVRLFEQFGDRIRHLVFPFYPVSGPALQNPYWLVYLWLVSYPTVIGIFKWIFCSIGSSIHTFKALIFLLVISFQHYAMGDEGFALA